MHICLRILTKIANLLLILKYILQNNIYRYNQNNSIVLLLQYKNIEWTHYSYKNCITNNINFSFNITCQVCLQPVINLYKKVIKKNRCIEYSPFGSKNYEIVPGFVKIMDGNTFLPISHSCLIIETNFDNLTIYMCVINAR